MNFIQKIYQELKSALYCIDNPEVAREQWVEKQLSLLEDGQLLLDAGCGPQPYKKFYKHLKCKTQDFGAYDGKGNGSGMQNGEDWHYTELDYTSDIWDIPEKDGSFDAILCTEVIEHIPYPNETLAEFSRLLKSGGKIILTAPYACLPHMQPYFFYSGFSEDYFKYMCEKNGMDILRLDKNGNAFTHVFQEYKRSYEHVDGLIGKALYLTIFVFAAPYLKFKAVTCKKETDLHFGFMLVAQKK